MNLNRMSLIWATDDFCIHGVPYAGFPLILDEEMRGVDPANNFLRHYLLNRGRVGSKKSWKTLAYALYDYFGFLESKGLAWDCIESGEDQSPIAAYRNDCLGPKKLHPNTVRQWLGVVCAFYDHAVHKNWITIRPYSPESVTDAAPERFLEHISASGGKAISKDVLPKTTKSLPKFLQREQCFNLLRNTTNPHHKMIMEFALRSGLRREELSTFPAAYVFDPARVGRTQRSIKIRLDPYDGHGIKTKSHKPRDIYVTRSMMSDLWHYLICVRGERAALGDEQQNPLFLNQDGKPYAADGKGIEVIVRDAGRRIGLKVYPHMLRHTYATYTLIDLRKIKSDLEPLIFLKRQLGHESILTTMIYTHLVDDVVEKAIFDFDDEITRASRT